MTPSPAQIANGTKTTTSPLSTRRTPPPEKIKPTVLNGDDCKIASLSIEPCNRTKYSLEQCGKPQGPRPFSPLVFYNTTARITWKPLEVKKDCYPSYTGSTTALIEVKRFPNTQTRYINRSRHPPRLKKSQQSNIKRVFLEESQTTSSMQYQTSTFKLLNEAVEIPRG